jgi:Xaa-Pro aminopeptidase
VSSSILRSINSLLKIIYFMRYTSPPSQLFSNNRHRFSAAMERNAIAVFNSNDIMPTSADGTMPFIQQSDMYYLTGIDQEETVLLIAPDGTDKHRREVLFIKETSKETAIWEGEKLFLQEAREISGIKSVYWLSQLESILHTLIVESIHIYLNSNEHLRSSRIVQTRDDRFSEWCRKKYPMHIYRRAQPILHSLRTIKSQEEIDQIQKAVDITDQGFRRAAKFIQPGVFEFEIEAEMIHEFLRQRSRRFAFQPIIASGYNACVLHYVENKDMCKDGELVLMDFGAEYGNYNADLTRCLPVNGKFSKRQREVYDAVLRVQREAMSMLEVGNNINDYHTEVGKIMESELLGLGLLSKTDIKLQNPDNPAYRTYFMHGTSHHLGIDVHDYGYPSMKMKEGMVFTVEPGIYIRQENLGIRLENDVVIQKNGILDLTQNVPIEAEEVEELMN